VIDDELLFIDRRVYSCTVRARVRIALRRLPSGEGALGRLEDLDLERITLRHVARMHRAAMAMSGSGSVSTG